MQIKSFRDLRVWQAGIGLVRIVYELTSKFPRSETYGLASQMQRAAVSIPSNIAEGHARESTKEYLQHLSIAQASLAELETQLEIARQLNYISEAETTQLLERISSLGRQLFALRNALMNPKAKSASPGS
jgi:four helix bundle protein